MCNPVPPGLIFLIVLMSSETVRTHFPEIEWECLQSVAVFACSDVHLVSLAYLSNVLHVVGSVIAFADPGY